MKALKKLVSILSVGLCFCLSAAFVSCSKNGNKQICAGFYKIDDVTVQKIQKALSDLGKNNNFEVSFKEVSSESELADALKEREIQLVFTSAGNGQRTCNSYVKGNAGISEDIFGNLSTSMRQAIVKNNSLAAAVPVLCDNLEIDVNSYDFRNSTTKAINDWNDVEKFLAYEKKIYKTPMAFAGSDPVAFFDMLGGLCEALDGPAYYQKSLEILNEGGSPDEIARKLLGSPTSPMVNTAITLKKFFRNGLIFADSFNLNTKDLERYAQSGEIDFMIMSLSAHRTFNYSVIKNYSSAYIPSKNEAALRTFTSNVIYAIPASKNQDVKDFVKLLMEDESQENLSRASGLAPVSKSCRTPDVQSDDARYWIAATNTPFAGLGHDTNTSETDLRNIENCIKNILLYE